MQIKQETRNLSTSLATSSKQETSSGFSAIFLLIIVVVVALGILAITVAKNSYKEGPATVPTAVFDEQVKKLQTQSSSDEVGAIEKDTNDTNLENLDQGTDQIEKDLAGVQ